MTLVSDSFSLSNSLRNTSRLQKTPNYSASLGSEIFLYPFVLIVTEN